MWSYLSKLFMVKRCWLWFAGQLRAIQRELAGRASRFERLVNEIIKCEQPVNSVHCGRQSICLVIGEVSQDVMNVSVDEWRSLKRCVDMNEFALDIPSTQRDSALGDANDLCNIINAGGSSMGI